MFQVQELINKLELLKFAEVAKADTDSVLARFSDQKSADEKNSLSIKYDVILDVTMGIQSVAEGSSMDTSVATRNLHILQCAYLLIVPGGHFVTACLDQMLRVDNERTVPFSEHQWLSDNRSHCTEKLSMPAPHEHISFVSVRRRAICCNTSAARYWGSGGCEQVGDGGPATGDLGIERQLLEEITICRPARVYNKEGVMEALSDAMRQQAMEALQKHGLCVIRRLFDPSVGVSSFM